MAIVGLRAVNRDGSDLTGGQAIVRVLVTPLSFLVFFLGFWLILIRGDRRGLHDLIARTAVVYGWMRGPRTFGFSRRSLHRGGPRGRASRVAALVARYRAVSTRNSLSSGSAMSTQSLSPPLASIRVAPRATRRSTSSCRSTWSATMSRYSRFLPVLGASGGPQVIIGPVLSGARIAVSSS